MLKENEVQIIISFLSQLKNGDNEIVNQIGGTFSKEEKKQLIALTDWIKGLKATEEEFVILSDFIEEIQNLLFGYSQQNFGDLLHIEGSDQLQALKHTINIHSEELQEVYSEYEENKIKLENLNKRLQQELKTAAHRERSLKVINSFAIDLFSAYTVDEVVWLVAKKAIALLDFPDCVVYLYDEEKQLLYQAAAHGPKNPVALDIANPITIPLGEGIVGSVAKNRKSEIVNDTSKDDRYILDDAYRYSEITVPLYYGDTLIGVIDSEHEEKNYFEEVDLETLNTIASFVSTKIVQTRAINNLNENKLQLEKALVNLKEANEVKNTFMAKMSHEMRTPMNSIIGFSELLKESELNKEQSAHLNIIHNQSLVLLHLISEVLDLSKVKSDKFSLSQKPLNLHNLLEEKTNALKLRASQQNSDLILSVHKKVTKLILADEMRLGQILSNILSNSIKFTKNGKIHLSVGVEKDDKKSQSIRFTIKDTGKGIKKENLDLIFEPFVQGKDKESSNGTGLGLSIVKELVNAMKGSIELKSVVGKGTTIDVLISFIKSEERKRKTKSNIEMNQTDLNLNLSGKSILVAEDNVFNQYLIESILQKWGVEVSIAENGQKAIEFLEGNSYDLILMDFQMPVKDGIETTRAIRNELDLKIPIIGLSANTMEESIKESLEAGMDGYVSKPIDRELLKKEIGKLLYSSNENENDTADGANEKSGNEVKQKAILGKAFMLDMFDNFNVDTIPLLEVFVKATEQMLEDLRDCFEKEDYELIKKMAHKMKSSFYQMKFNEHGDLSTKIVNASVEDESNKAITRSNVEELLKISELLLDEIRFFIENKSFKTY